MLMIWLIKKFYDCLHNQIGYLKSHSVTHSAWEIKLLEWSLISHMLMIRLKKKGFHDYSQYKNRHFESHPVTQFAYS